MQCADRDPEIAVSCRRTDLSPVHGASIHANIEWKMGRSRKTRQSFPKEHLLLGGFEEDDPVLTLVIVRRNRAGGCHGFGRQIAQAMRFFWPSAVQACREPARVTKMAMKQAGPLDRADRLER